MCFILTEKKILFAFIDVTCYHDTFAEHVIRKYPAQHMKGIQLYEKLISVKNDTLSIKN